MENSKFNWSWIVVIVVIGVLIGFAVAPFFHMGYPWWHFYARLGIVCLVLIAFGVLRLYNSIVQNTRFLIKLKNAVDKLLNQFIGLDRAISSLNNSAKSLKSSMDAKEHNKK